MNKFRSAILGGEAPAFGSPLIVQKRGQAADGDNLASVAVPRDAIRTADHRDDDRHRLGGETASILFEGESHVVDLINLSGGGAMISSDVKPLLWQRVDLILGEGGAIECAVRWLRGDRIGLEFAHETRIDCDPEQRDAVLLEVLRRSFPDLSLPAAAPPVVEKKEEAPAVAEEDPRRSDRRHPLVWNGEILWQHDSHKVRLRNISESGALIDCNLDLPLGAELMLDLGESRQLFANVSWSRSGQAGLIFTEKFDLARLAAAKPEVAEGWQRPSPRQSTNETSPWASEWQRCSIDELRIELEGFLKR